MITIKLWDKLKVRQMIGSQLILFHLMLKQRFNWFTLAQEEQEIEKKISNEVIFILQKMAREINPVCNFIVGSICTCLLTDTVIVEFDYQDGKGYLHIP